MTLHPSVPRVSPRRCPVAPVPLVVGLLMLAGAKGCEDRQEKAASRAYQRALREHEERFASFQQKYLHLERRLSALRRTRPAEAARRIRRQMLPLLAGVLEGFDRVLAAGRAYVSLLPDSVATKRTLRAQLARFERQRSLFRTVRGTYREEAKLLRRGAPRREALEVILERRLDAARRLERGDAPLRRTPLRGLPRAAGSGSAAPPAGHGAEREAE